MKTAAWTMLAVLGAAAALSLEELLPKPGGAGFPVLFCIALWFAAMRPAQGRDGGARPARGPALLFALAAGGAEDAVSLLPAPACTVFFPAAAAVCAMLNERRLPGGGAAGAWADFAFYALSCAAAWACCQLWLWAWLGGEIEDNVFLRTLAAWPVAAATAAAVHPALAFAAEKAGLAQ